jgi:predicted acetyltransferase
LEKRVTISVRDARQRMGDRAWIEGAYREYLHDLGPSGADAFPLIHEYGEREPDTLARWFTDREAVPMVILRGDEPVGFAMIARGSATPGGRAPAGGRIDFRMAEFFVSRPFRRLRVGHIAAQLILDRFAGHWEVTEFMRNRGAVSFWRGVIGDYTGGRFQERVSNGEVRQTFESGARNRSRSG